MIEDHHIQTILNDLLEIHGYDFSGYSPVSFKRRVNRLYNMDKFPSFAEFRYKIKNDKDFFRRFVEEVTVNVTEMFRDPSFHLCLKNEILPTLATYPLIRIWHAGCSTGEEVYSMAILLHECGLLHKSLLYATDINPGVLIKAKKGIFPLSELKSYSENYIDAGGTQDFSSYYSAKYNYAKFKDFLSEKMIFSTHNLIADKSFNVFQLIICRNVLIYFNRELQNKVFGLFDDSLEKLGYLGLGSKETLRFSSIEEKFKQVNVKEKIYRKISL